MLLLTKVIWLVDPGQPAGMVAAPPPFHERISTAFGVPGIAPGSAPSSGSPAPSALMTGQSSTAFEPEVWEVPATVHSGAFSAPFPLTSRAPSQVELTIT